MNAGQTTKLPDVYALTVQEPAASDAVILEVISRLLVSLNLEAAAEDYLAAAGYVCSHRPHLAEQLLAMPVDYIWQLGASSSEQVLAVVGFWLRDVGCVLHREATPEARQWLTQTLPTLTAVIDRLLERAHRRFVETFGEEH